MNDNETNKILKQNKIEGINKTDIMGPSCRRGLRVEGVRT